MLLKFLLHFASSLWSARPDPPHHHPHPPPLSNSAFWVNFTLPGCGSVPFLLHSSICAGWLFFGVGWGGENWTEFFKEALWCSFDCVCHYHTLSPHFSRNWLWQKINTVSAKYSMSGYSRNLIVSKSCCFANSAYHVFFFSLAKKKTWVGFILNRFLHVFSQKALPLLVNNKQMTVGFFL